MATIGDKLQSQNYSTHYIGDWGAGHKAWGQVPVQRGFDSSFGPLTDGSEVHPNTQKLSTGGIDLWANESPAHGETGNYLDSVFAKKAVRIIGQHASRQAMEKEPLFLVVSWHNTPADEGNDENSPTIPGEWHNPDMDIDSTTEAGRQLQEYEAMVHAMDTGVGAVQEALEANGLWSNTILVFFSAAGGLTWYNGHPRYASNYPLRSGKYSDFEGGVRSIGLLSGGFVRRIPSSHGRKYTGLIHVADLYATLSVVAGVQTRAAEDIVNLDLPGVLVPPPLGPRRVPPSDAVDVWAGVMEDGPSARTEVVLSPWAMIATDGTVGGELWKLVLTDEQAPGIRQRWASKGVSRAHVTTAVGAYWPLPEFDSEGSEGNGQGGGMNCAPHGCLFELREVIM
jgi:arylsulfatase A-like enzyme